MPFPRASSATCRPEPVCLQSSLLIAGGYWITQWPGDGVGFFMELRLAECWPVLYPTHVGLGIRIQ